MVVQKVFLLAGVRSIDGFQVGRVVRRGELESGGLGCGIWFGGICLVKFQVDVLLDPIVAIVVLLDFF